MSRSYYSNIINDFIKEDTESILGKLSIGHSFALETLQKNAWVRQIDILKKALSSYPKGKVFFEFSIPRMGKRADNIIVVNDLIFVVEFKIGERLYPKKALEQVVDYCLDLKNFHGGSHNRNIIPILVSSKAPFFKNTISQVEGVFEALKTNEEFLGQTINEVVESFSNGTIDVDEWENSLYKPTPTIIEAAQALYKGHNVKEISRNDAGAINLSKTSARLSEIVDSAKSLSKKKICFLTGVPGAGKTLAGLNIANERMKKDENEHAVFLSGNGPLVHVLREALTRDEIMSSKIKGIKTTKKIVASKAHAFIQNIHHFRDDNLKSSDAPIEKVVVFDEAQRAWHKEQASAFMSRKKGIENFEMSEPEFLISVLDRHNDWCTIICLIGGGQEINTGEAGMSEWIRALKTRFPNWQTHYSANLLSDRIYLQDIDLVDWLQKNGTSENDLHLSVSVRSFRSEMVSTLVEYIIQGNSNKAKELYSKIKCNFPIAITRNLQVAKSWLRNKARGSERYGIIASSGAKRLRPAGIDVNNVIDAANWFLNESSDIRSSNHLEDVATEFDIQGLEIDWACLAWDINFFYENKVWKHKKFVGTNWQNINKETDVKFLENTYRVLLTRARQGLIIYVPKGDSDDATRPEYQYDNIYNFLISCGFEITDEL